MGRVAVVDRRGRGGAYQLAAAAAFVQALNPATRTSAFGLAQSGLYAVQGLGILAGGAIAQAVGAPLAVGLAGLVGLTAATMLAMIWTRLRLQLIAAQRGQGGLTYRVGRSILWSRATREERTCPRAPRIRTCCRSTTS